MKRALPYLLCVFLALPSTLILTVLLSPFWNWFEAVSGIESQGHSGPANWCFVAVYILLASVFVIWYLTRKRKVLG
jgi:hypothetical protein